MYYYIYVYIYYIKFLRKLRCEVHVQRRFGGDIVRRSTLSYSEICRSEAPLYL